MNEEHNNKPKRDFKDSFSSNKTTLILGGIIILLLLVSAFVLLGDSDENKKELAQKPVIDSPDGGFENGAFVEDDMFNTSPDYDEEISKQYEEYQKVKEVKQKEADKKAEETKNKETAKNNAGKGNANNGGSSNGGSNNGGSNNSGGNNNGGITLPPVNIGDKNPTVPKLPDVKNPPVNTAPPVTDPKPVVPNPGNGNGGIKPVQPSKPTPPVTDPVTPPVKDPVTPPVTPPVTDPVTPPVTDPEPEPNPGPPKPPTDFGSVEVIEEPRPIDTTPHSGLNGDQFTSKYGGNTVGTNYGNGFALLPVRFEKNAGGTQVEFDIHNSGTKNLVITDKDLRFEYFTSAPSGDVGRISGGTVTILPGETKRVMLISSYDATIVLFQHSGSEFMFDFSQNTQVITNTKEISKDFSWSVDDAGYFHPIKGAQDENGNAYFKSEMLGIKMTGNLDLGPLKVSSKGMIGLLNVNIANTGSGDLKVTSIDVYSWDGSNASTKNAGKTTFAINDLKLLGGAAIPTTIKSKTIANGYVPFYLKDGNHTTEVVVHMEAGGKKFAVLYKGSESMNLMP